MGVQAVVDGTPFRRSLNILPIQELGKKFAQQGSQAALQSVARISAKGDAMARPSNGGNMIAQSAQTYFVESVREGEVVVKFVDPPAISWQFDTRM